MNESGYANHAEESGNYVLARIKRGNVIQFWTGEMWGDEDSRESEPALTTKYKKAARYKTAREAYDDCGDKPKLYYFHVINLYAPSVCEDGFRPLWWTR